MSNLFKVVQELEIYNTLEHSFTSNLSKTPKLGISSDLQKNLQIFNN